VANSYLGCPCYDNASGGVIVFTSSIIYSAIPITITCATINSASFFLGYTVYNSPSTPCDISTALPSVCDPTTTLSNIHYASTSASIPTLSEWGLIVLALLLMTFGTLALLQPKWKGRFEQEG